MNISLGQLIDRLDREGLLSPGSSPGFDAMNAAVLDVTTDSRTIASGSVFCAIRGYDCDGHAFLEEAAAAGALAALVEEPTPGLDLLQITVSNGRLAAACAAAAFYADPWSDLTLVGITGTNGKTTSAAILRHMLSQEVPTGSIGTLGALGPDGEVVPGTEGLTTPGPIAFARWLRQLHSNGARAVAMEVSSHSLDQGRVAAARFDAALFTNLSRDHLDYHGTLEEYRAAKLLLVNLVKPGGAVVINADDTAWHDVAAPDSRVIRFGLRETSDVSAADIGASTAGMEFTLRTPDGSMHVSLPLFGLYNVSNALGVAAVLWGLGWSLEMIVVGLRDIPQVPGRLERVPTPEGAPTVVIDFAHTADALERALGALRPLTPGRLIVVFGAGGDRDPGKRAGMGRAAAEGADLSIVTSDNPRTESPEQIAVEVENGMGNAPRRRVIDRREAIRTALSEAGSGDLVLLAGKGHETYQIWGDERRPFDERAVVREIFAGTGANL
ncbi:UDP-N-acetylmuramoyl-L-alanyl-D-glutamate--2,6-diaminopimelate ligase [soil metagenome]